MKTLNIVMAFDQGYLPGAMVTLASAIHNLAAGSFLNIHILDCGLDDTDQITEGLQPLPQDRFKVQIRPMDMDLIKSIPLVIKHLSISAFSILKVQSLFPDLDRILFLDADLIVNRDLSQLADMDMDNFPIAAVQDPIAKVISYDIQNCGDLGLDSQAEYFNSGFVLFNLDQWRKEDWESKLNDVVLNPNIRRKYNDQSFLNVTFSNNWLPLPRAWNRLVVLQPGKYPLRPFFPSITHATWVFKPWQFPENGAKGVVKNFYHYLGKTDFKFPPTQNFPHNNSITHRGELRRAFRHLLSELGFDPWIYRIKALFSR
jgi:lipopolysaccharide biosynthesis glycosyltransferase